MREAASTLFFFYIIKKNFCSTFPPPTTQGPLPLSPGPPLFITTTCVIVWKGGGVAPLFISLFFPPPWRWWIGAARAKNFKMKICGERGGGFPTLDRRSRAFGGGGVVPPPSSQRRGGGMKGFIIYIDIYIWWNLLRRGGPYTGGVCISHGPSGQEGRSRVAGSIFYPQPSPHPHSVPLCGWELGFIIYIDIYIR
nr:hypothetical protein [Morchella crassipes]